MAKREDISSIDIQKVLLDMREYRMGLIQTPDQLRFSYMAVIEGARLILKDNKIQVCSPPGTWCHSDNYPPVFGVCQIQVDFTEVPGVILRINHLFGVLPLKYFNKVAFVSDEESLRFA